MRSEWGYRVAGLGAVAGAGLRLAIVVAFAATGLGAAGDRSYGSFSKLTFIPACALAVSAVGLYAVFSARVGRAGRLGLVTIGSGLAFAAIGEFGGEWLALPRSGNILIVPGHVLAMVGLIAFSMSARHTTIATRYRILALLIAFLPLVFLSLAAAFESATGNSFPPSLHDTYFRISYALASLLWLALGILLLRDSVATTSSA